MSLPRPRSFSTPARMFAGTHTALITPFKDGKVDFDAFHALIDRQAEAGIDGIVPVGTTGESPTLDAAEHLEVIANGIDNLRQYFQWRRCVIELASTMIRNHHSVGADTLAWYGGA